MAVAVASGTTDQLASGTVSPLTLTYSRAPVAGELLLVYVIAHQPTTNPTIPTPTGYTAGPTKTMSTGGATEVARMSMFWRLATGGEGASVSVAFTATSAQALLRDRTGLDTTSPHDVDGTGVAASTATATLTPSITNVAANAWIDTATAFSNVSTGVTYGGGSTQDNALAGANNVGISTGTQTVSSAALQSPTCSWTGGATSNFIAASMSFKLAAGTTPISLADTAAGTDALAVTATQPLADTGSGTDALTTNATAPLSDTGIGTEVLATSATGPPLTDTGTGSDTIAVSATSPLADTAAGSDTITVAATGPPLTDTATGVEALTTTASAPLSDAGAATDLLTVNAKPPGLTDSATGTDALAVTVLVSLSDSAVATDTLGTTARISLVETGTFTDQLGTTAHVTFTDIGNLAEILQIIEPARDITIMAGPTTTSYASGPTTTSYGTGPTATRYATGPTVS